MDPFWDKVFWFLLVAVCGGVGWLAKSILKPWSDAALIRSKAFTDMVRVLEGAIPGIKDNLEVLKNASKESNIALDKNTKAADKQTEKLDEHLDWWKQFGSDPFKEICQAEAVAAALKACSETTPGCPRGMKGHGEE